MSVSILDEESSGECGLSIDFSLFWYIVLCQSP